MFNWLQDIDNYDTRKVADKETHNGLTVSTAFTSDEGYETAILDASGSHPVERYETLFKARIGHAKWFDFCKQWKGDKVTKLGGLSGLVEDKQITLKPEATQ